MALIFIDVEAWGGCPSTGQMTEFGAVEYNSRKTFHGKLIESQPNPDNPAVPLPTRCLTNSEMTPVFAMFEGWLKQFQPGRLIMVSDNPAYDYQWINDGFWRTLGYNPLGHSARRIGDFYAGLIGTFYARQDWKRLRVTKHTHHPVDDAMGNVEAFERLLKGER